MTSPPGSDSATLEHLAGHPTFVPPKQSYSDVLSARRQSQTFSTRVVTLYRIAS